MGNASEQMIANEQERFKERLARHIGLSNDEFGTLSYKLNTEESEDGMPYNHVLTFERNKNTSRILSKIKSLNHNDQIIIDASTYENL